MVEPGTSVSRAPKVWAEPPFVDALVLALIVALSAAPYIGSLGFYSDDWELLTRFDAIAADGRSVVADAILTFDARPVQGAYLTTLFALFQFDPAGYHLVNTAVIAASIILLYFLLLRIGLSRAEAFASALLFALLPQLSTVRVWYAAFQVPLSMAMALASMHAQLSFARTGRVGWVLAAVAAALASLGAYEIFAPSIAGFAAGVWFTRASRSVPNAQRFARGTGIVLLSVVAAVAAGVVVKALASDRTGELADLNRYMAGAWQLVRPDYDWRVDSSLNIFAATAVHFWHPLVGWASAAAKLFVDARTPTLIIVPLIAALAFWRLRNSATGERFSGYSAGHLLMLGLAAFVLGHATFLIVPSIVFAPTGIGNRTLVAAAIGVALIMVALASLAVRGLPSRYHGTAFAAGVALLAVGGAARLQQIERYWAEAPGLQRQILKAARTDLAALPAGSTVLLDGVCPYHGPAVVFETYWDFGPALSLALGKQVEGDAVSPRMRLTAAGVETWIYDVPKLHTYGPRLFAYNPVARRTVQLPDATAAHRHFGPNVASKCPGHVARGVPI